MFRKMFLLWLVRVVVAGAAIAFLLRDRVPVPLVAIAAVLGAVLLNVALSMLRAGAKSQRDAELIARALSGNDPRDGERIAFAGTIRVDGEPLRSPFSDAECAVFSYDVTHEERTGTNTSQGIDRSTRTVTDFSGLALAKASIETRNGSFGLLSFPFVEGFPAGFRESAQERANAAAYLSRTSFEKMGAIGRAMGAMGEFDNAVSEAEGAFRRDWEGAGRRDVNELKLSEVWVPVDVEAVAIGVYDESRRGVRSESGSNELRLISGDAGKVESRLAGARHRSRSTAAWVAAPTLALLAALFFAPSWILHRIPGGGALLEMQGQSVADALRNDDVRRLSRLVASIDPNQPVDGDRVPLMMARSAAAARILLDAGADANAHRGQQLSVLMEIAESGAPELLQVLLAAGAELNEVNGIWNKTPISFARDANNIPAVEALLDAGATDSVIEENGGEPLHEESSPLRAIEAYLDAHASPGSDDSTWTYSGTMTKDRAHVRLEKQRPDGQSEYRDMILDRQDGKWVVTSDGGNA